MPDHASDGKLITGQLQKLGDHTWVFPPDPNSSKVQPSVGVICDDEKTVLVDAGNSPAHAHAVIAALQAINAPPIHAVIYTHCHWDHIFGAPAFDVPIIAHETCRQRVEEYAARPWSEQYLRDIIAERPQAAVSFGRILALIDDWDAFEIKIPTKVFTEKIHTLQLNGVTVEIEHIGGNHSDDSTIVRAVEDRVMYLSDSYYPGATSPAPDLDMVKNFLDQRYAYYVDGHAGAMTYDEFLARYNEQS
jgi:glyoxylase-like metal-dependent hydrolase (beta-lactamase superfamily II)